MNKQFELILFNKYLIRADDFNFILGIKKPRKGAVINIKDGTKDYSNFKDTYFFPTFSGCLLKIKDLEIKQSNVKTAEDLIEKLNDIDSKILSIKNKFL